MKTKRCGTCKKMVEVNQFRNRSDTPDGLAYTCKPCYRVQDSDRYYKNRKKRLAKDNKYFRSHRKECYARLEKYRLLYPEKHKARQTLRNAVAQGKVTKKPCEVCGNKIVHGHHEDYSKPLQVIWLCSTHHGERHRKIKR